MNTSIHPSNAAEYEELLRRMDWHYSYSDDHSVYTRGYEAMTAARIWQKANDSSGLIWNQYAPKEFQVNRRP
jgi:uncharacterized protein YaeQ